MSITGQFVGHQVSNLAPFTSPSILGSLWKGIWPGTVGRTNYTTFDKNKESPQTDSMHIKVNSTNIYLVSTLPWTSRSLQTSRGGSEHIFTQITTQLHLQRTRVWEMWFKVISFVGFFFFLFIAELGWLKVCHGESINDSSALISYSQQSFVCFCVSLSAYNITIRETSGSLTSAYFPESIQCTVLFLTIRILTGKADGGMS